MHVNSSWTWIDFHVAAFSLELCHRIAKGKQVNNPAFGNEYSATIMVTYVNHRGSV
jgi:hypothetical protein